MLSLQSIAKLTPRVQSLARSERGETKICLLSLQGAGSSKTVQSKQYLIFHPRVKDYNLLNVNYATMDSWAVVLKLRHWMIKNFIPLTLKSISYKSADKFSFASL